MKYLILLLATVLFLLIETRYTFKSEVKPVSVIVDKTLAFSRKRNELDITVRPEIYEVPAEFNPLVKGVGGWFWKMVDNLRQAVRRTFPVCGTRT